LLRFLIQTWNVGAYKVSQLWTYPVKSLGGIAVQQARVLQKGLETDRRWMLIDDENTFMTQRVHHKMALFRPSWAGDKLMVSHLESSVLVPAVPLGEECRAMIWDDVVEVIEVHPNVSQWFSERLGKACKFVSFPEEKIRSVDPKYNLGDDQVSLADGYPLLVIGQGTLDDLNSRLSQPVPMNRFRPNIVFTGGDPFVEDTWTTFAVGVNRFAAVKPCARCVLPTVDQETGVMGKEPLATLSTYRRRNGKVYFGMNLIPLDHLTISVGDEITF
jgi:uncharacterized protein YcbX